MLPLKTLVLSVSQIVGAGALVIAGGGLDHQFWGKKYAPDTERHNICSTKFHKVTMIKFHQEAQGTKYIFF